MSCIREDLRGDRRELLLRVGPDEPGFADGVGLAFVRRRRRR